MRGLDHPLAEQGGLAPPRRALGNVVSNESTKTNRTWSEHPGIVVAVFVVSLVFMVVRQQLEDSTWVPHGAPYYVALL